MIIISPVSIRIEYWLSVTSLLQYDCNLPFAGNAYASFEACIINRPHATLRISILACRAAPVSAARNQAGTQISTVPVWIDLSGWAKFPTNFFSPAPICFVVNNTSTLCHMYSYSVPCFRDQSICLCLKAGFCSEAWCPAWEVESRNQNPWLFDTHLKEFRRVPMI